MYKICLENGDMVESSGCGTAVAQMRKKYVGPKLQGCVYEGSLVGE
jgi:hypothetical protein